MDIDILGRSTEMGKHLEMGLLSMMTIDVKELGLMIKLMVFVRNHLIQSDFVRYLSLSEENMLGRDEIL